MTRFDLSPAFEEPWQASAFAMAVKLHESGLFTWAEWAETLSQVIKDKDHADCGYYEQWLEALERLIEQKQVASHAEIDGLALAWARAAEATPHGKAIALGNDPLHNIGDPTGERM
jgi:nitrile hydratase accessory protein